MSSEKAEISSKFLAFNTVAWFAIALVSMAWGLAVGVNLAGENFMGLASMLTGTIVLFGLIITLVVASRAK